MLIWKSFQFKISFVCLLAFFFLLSPLSVYAGSQEFLGIDVSENNGVVDWEAVYDAGYRFAMIKTGDGQDVGNSNDIDPTFETNYKNAKEAGLECGVYHMIAGSTVEAAKKEAEYCLSILGNRELELPIAYDIETTKDFSDSTLFQSGKKNITDMAIAFCETIKKAGYTPMIYTSAYIYNHYLDQSRLKDYKIWIAHHGVDRPNISTAYHIWQFDIASLPGANTSSGDCDLDLLTETLTLKNRSIALGKGEKITLTPALTTAFSDESLSFRSSNPKVATVSSSGKVTAKKLGTTTITIKTAHNTKVTCKITVKKAPTSIRFLENKKTLKAKSLVSGQTYQLKYSFSSGATSNKLTFTSSKKSVATVSNTGKITAKKAGTSIITIKTYNGKTAKLKVTVTSKNTKSSLSGFWNSSEHQLQILPWNHESFT